MNFAVPADYKLKMKAVEHKSDGDTNSNWRTWNDLKRPGNGAEITDDQRNIQDNPDTNIAKTK